MYIKIKYTIHIIRYLCIILLIFYSQRAFAQIFDFEQNPPSVKWQQINTSKFRLIYPTSLQKDAQYIANLLDTSIHSINRPFRTNHRKIPIILQNQSVESNGFVQLAPWRSEFLTTPPQQSDPMNWLHGLPIHEYRHVVQMDKLTRSIRPPFELLGLAFFGVALPSWFYEGDAVEMETLLTPAGRGRLPSWEMPMRTNLLEGKEYTYSKNYLGSLVDITPGYYQLGYFMTTKLSRDYGSDIENNILDRISKNPLRPYNFSNSLKQYTGYTTRQWHDRTIDDLKEKWKAQTEENRPEIYPVLPHIDSSKRADFLLPQVIGKDTLITLYRTPLSVNSIILLTSDGTQKNIIKTGIQTFPNFSYRKGKVTWDEVRLDKRFHKRSFNIINVYDIKSKRYKQLTHKTRLFSPTLSPNAEEIAAVEIDLSNRVSLVILNADNGNELIRIQSPRNALLQTPSFSPDGKKVIATIITDNGAGLIEFALATKSNKIILPNTYQQIERPIYADSVILFKAHYNGIDNLYSLNPTTQDISQLTNAPFGAFNPTYDSSTATLWFNNYQANGYQISRIQLNEISLTPISKIKNTFISYFKPLLASKNTPIDKDTSSIKKFATEPYNDWRHLLNFHSISIGSDDFHSLDDLKLGALLLSDNLLNTLSMRYGVAYDQKIHRAEYTASLSYHRYFPIFTLDYRNSGKLAGISSNDKINTVRWRENIINFSMQIPFRMNRLNQIYQTGLIAGTSYTHRYHMNLPEIKNSFIKELEFPLHYGFYINRNSRKSSLDLAPKWGQNITIDYHHFPFGKQIKGNAFTLRSAFYFPGILKNHSLRARFNYQHNTGNFIYSNAIPMVNGFDQLPASRPKNTLLVDYRFPIAYPDWTIGPLGYVRRIKAGVFSDFENIGIRHNTRPRTFGGELRADMNLLRFFLPIFDVGIKAIYANEPGYKKWIWQAGISYSY